MAQSTIPVELQNPQNAIGGERMIFGEMLGWGAREAISECNINGRSTSDPHDETDIYNSNKETMIRENIQNAALELDDSANR